MAPVDLDQEDVAVLVKREKRCRTAACLALMTTNTPIVLSTTSNPEMFSGSATAPVRTSCASADRSSHRFGAASQPLPLFRSHLLPLLDGIPRSGAGEFVRRGEELNAVDTEQALEIG